MRLTRIWILLCLLLTACGGGSGDSGNSGPAPANSNDASDAGAAPTSGQDNTDNTPDTSGTDGFGTPSDSQIRPGVIIEAEGSQCTSNFIYADAADNFYIGAAAHCFSPDSNSGVDPCEAHNEALGTEVVIQNAAFVGELVYSSWQSMQDAGETPGSGICLGNDFAVIKIDPRDADNVHPAARVFGGPTALFEGDANTGDDVFTYGQSPLNLGLVFTRAKRGSINGQSGDGWLYDISLDSPALPGDSGSAVLHEFGKALGVLSTLNACIGLCPLTSNSAVNLEMALAYANSKAFDSRLRLLTWAEFSP